MQFNSDFAQKYKDIRLKVAVDVDKSARNPLIVFDTLNYDLSGTSIHFLIFVSSSGLHEEGGDYSS